MLNYCSISPASKGMFPAAEGRTRDCIVAQKSSQNRIPNYQLIVPDLECIFVLHFAPSVHMRTTPTPFPDKPNLAVKAENISQWHPIFRTCNEDKM